MKFDEKPDFFRITWEEIENNSYDKSALSRAFAFSDGDENKTKSAYIKIRVAILEEEYAVRLEQEKSYRAQILKEEIRANREAQLAKDREARACAEEQRRIRENAKREERGGFLVCGCPIGEAAVKNGDVIIEIDGVDVRGMDAIEIGFNATRKLTMVRGVDIISISPDSNGIQNFKLSKLANH